MRTALDTIVLSTIWDQEATADRLIDVLNDSKRRGSVVLCAAAFAETLAHPSMTGSAIREFLGETGIFVDFKMEEQVWIEVGRSYARYATPRRRSSPEQPRRILADFIIGAHALLTADRLSRWIVGGMSETFQSWF